MNYRKSTIFPIKSKLYSVTGRCATSEGPGRGRIAFTEAHKQAVGHANPSAQALRRVAANADASVCTVTFACTTPQVSGGRAGSEYGHRGARTAAVMTESLARACKNHTTRTEEKSDETEMNVYLEGTRVVRKETRWWREWR